MWLQGHRATRRHPTWPALQPPAPPESNTYGYAAPYAPSAYGNSPPPAYPQPYAYGYAPPSAYGPPPGVMDDAMQTYQYYYHHVLPAPPEAVEVHPAASDVSATTSTSQATEASTEGSGSGTPKPSKPSPTHGGKPGKHTPGASPGKTTTHKTPQPTGRPGEQSVEPVVTIFSTVTVETVTVTAGGPVSTTAPGPTTTAPAVVTGL